MTTPSPSLMPGAAPEPQVDSPEPPKLEAPKADAPKPPWGSDDDFDPNRAWSLIQNVRSENGDLKAKLQDVQPILDAHDQQRRDEQGEIATAREDAAQATEQAAAWRSEAVRAKAEALAAGRFIDTDTALTLIGDLSGYATDAGIDIERLTGRLDQLAQDKPFLLAPPPQGFTPNRGQGQSGTGPIPLDAQIQAAQERGDVMQSIALKQQRFYQKP